MDMDKITELCDKTSFSRKKCEKVLRDKNGNMQEALEYLMKLRENKTEVALDNLSAYIIGEKGKKFTIYDKDKVLISFPIVIAILFLLFFNVASWIIALLLVLLLAFDLDIKIESNIKKTKQEYGTIPVSAYRNNNRSEKKTSSDTNREGSADYNELTIE